MSDKELTVLASVALLLLLAAVILYSGIGCPADTFQPGTLLVQGLNPEKIGSIAIAKGEEAVTLKRQGDGFQVVEKNGYPADTEKINELLINSLEIRLAQKVSGSAGSHAELGVDEGGAEAVRVTFTDAEGKELAGFIKGKSPDRNPGAYVRLKGADAVYESEKGIYISAEPTDFVDRKLVAAKSDDVERVSVTVAGEPPYSISRDDADNVVLESIPAGKAPKGSEYKSVFSALSNLSLTDIVPLESLGAEWPSLYECRMKSGLVYRVRVATKDEKYYVRLAAEGPNVTQVQITREESDEELKAKEAVLLAVDEAKKFNARHGAWAYEVSKYAAEKLGKPLADLVEEPKADDEEEG